MNNTKESCFKMSFGGLKPEAKELERSTLLWLE